MSRFRHFIAISCLLVVVFHPNFGPILASDTLFPEDQIEEFRLPNGMTFLLMNHGETPTFSAYIRVRVGGMDEPPGSSGLAHVIEHMAFKGTKEWGTKDWEREKPLLRKIEEVGEELAAEYGRDKGQRQAVIDNLKRRLEELYAEHRQYLEPEEISREIQRRGGLNFNATTSQDLTSYYVSLSTSEIEFWATLESERIFRPIFREFYLERDVVLEERRTRVIDSPFGALYAELMQEAFRGSPYGFPTIGLKQDLLTLTRTKAEKFFREHYRPEKSVGAIVGQFSIPKVKKLLEKTFGKITSRPHPNPLLGKERGSQLEIVSPPYNRHDCRIELKRPAQSRLLIGYHKPPMPAREDYVFDLIATLLTEDRSSRLYRSLVIEQGLATSVDAYASVPGSRLPNQFLLILVPRGGVSLKRLQAATEKELHRLTIQPVSADELKQAQKKLINQQIWGLEENENIASELTYYQAIAGDWRYRARYPEVIRSVTSAEIQKVAKKYFVSGNRCLGLLQGEKRG